MKLHSVRYSFFWKVIRFFSKPFLSIRFNFKTNKVSKITGPFILLSNHVTNLDPFFIQATFPQHLYLLVGEALLRMKVGWFLKFAIGVVSKNRTGTDYQSLAQIMRLLHEKKNICIFPEAKSTYNGQTSDINLTVAKLVKKSGAKLITYKIKGGYLSKPIWGKSIRRGKVTGGIVNIYSREDLEKLTVEALHQKITEDLYENAYETQKIKKIKYHGRNLAENMDSLYCVCPKCCKENVIGTRGNKVFCKNCGELAVYNEYGFFEAVERAAGNSKSAEASDSSGKFFENLIEWNEYQQKYFAERFEKAETSELLFKDNGFVLKEIANNHLEIWIGRGEYCLYKNRFDFIRDKTALTPLVKDEDLKAPVITFNFDDIQRIHILLAKNGHDRIEFSDNKGRHFELISRKNSCFANLIAMFENYK